ncbi:uncharacterized protein FisN_15Hh262 [Fistulifera solaris]|uniref:Uncharacterized protein n=1 Tax=Fistulifera solaris TaxID=1519565 RepID=A0A1Z5JFK7_FISSO|nr:uncharacterized protein FisN_15Hh262 [Fistulifera solaris]|eukprot:GAX12783.1 uncharacterized protein FisN_15Hh262 [Fistulifera solaris]
MVKSNALRNRVVLQESPRRTTATDRKILHPSRQSKGSTTPNDMILYLAIALVLMVIAACLIMYIHLIQFCYLSSPETSAQVPQTTTTTLYPPPFPEITRTRVDLSPQALEMCTRTLWHTVETTTIVLPNEETFIHTGDIDDLWLRDSAAQIHPLLVPFFNGTALIQQDPRLDRIVSGLILRTAMYIRHDPYANAFRIDDTYVFSAAQKAMGRHDLISTWNYELDSACYYMRMLYFYWKQAPSPERVLQRPAVEQAVEIMVDLWIAEQRHEEDAYPTGDLFDCVNCNKPYRYPGLPREGKGAPTNASSGLIWTGFRPSDDECEFNYLIPANMFAVVALEYMAEMADDLWNNDVLAKRARKLAAEVQRGIEEHAVIHHPNHGKIYAYEVDGLGGANLMDDANIPSLLSIPYLGYLHYDPQIYQNTRSFVLSPDNPTYNVGTFQGRKVEGVGSPHMKARIRKNVWPMSIAMQGLTSSDVAEKVRLIETLVATTGGTGWMHESIDPNRPQQFTRSWFCWYV